MMEDFKFDMKEKNDFNPYINIGKTGEQNIEGL